MLTKEWCETIEEIGWGDRWVEKGLKEGIKEGIEKGKLEDAQAMYADGLGIERISRITKIPIEQLREKLSVQ
ncbi:MAG: hypothetical protein LBT74_03700 [Acidobacteriota bacterium]|nr:hypothetical protein [Acidobacteriota bacterium]